ncbi:MAG: hypothetical protein WBE57_00290, partial [Xanthobacteraceae bacterium]
MPFATEFPQGDSLYARNSSTKAARGNPGSRCRRYSRLMGIDEAGVLARLQALRRDPIDPTIA